jgi:hypothetical protein
MLHRTRRELLHDVGKGMFLATLGGGLAADLGLGTAWAAEDPGRLTFGDLDPLVAFIHETPADKLLPKAIEKLNAGTDLKQLVAAAALANARAFGGEDYVGFHTLMALAPAFHMSAEETDAKKRPMAVLKVLFRNATRLDETGHHETLKAVRPDDKPATADRLRDAVRGKDLTAAESTFAGIAKQGSATDALDGLMPMVDDATEVHRVVLVSKAWELLDFVGKDRAHTLLRQSVRFCAKGEQSANYVKHYQEVRDLLPKLLDQHKLPGKTAGTRTVDDAWVEAFADTLFRAKPSAAAEAAAAALAEGISPAAVSEAIALAANQLVLRDEGRPKGQTSANKPAGSCHGDSIGVHACDSAHAWRAIARAGGARTAVTSLILGAYQVASDRANRGGDFLNWKPYPRAEHAEKVREVSPDALLKELDGAIRENNQSRAAALVERIGALKPDAAKQVFAVLRGYAVSEDGALHAEKFYRTTSDEFAAVRAAFRWRQMVALARVTASAHGQPAPGFKEARELLKV